MVVRCVGHDLTKAWDRIVNGLYGDFEAAYHIFLSVHSRRRSARVRRAVGGGLGGGAGPTSAVGVHSCMWTSQ